MVISRGGGNISKRQLGSALVLAAMVSSGAWAQNLRIGSAVVGCPAFLEVPVTFVQPDTSNVTTSAFEFNFSTEGFEERFIAPNDSSNQPLVLRGSALNTGVGSSFVVIAQQADSGGLLIPGRWRVTILATGATPFPNIPQGEILRLRFFPRTGAANATYPVTFQPGSASFFTSAGTPVGGLTTQDGSITLQSCAVVTTTTTTLPPPTTTLPPPTTTLPPTTTTLPPPTTTTTLPPSTTTLPPSSTTLPPSSTTTLPPSSTTLPPTTTTSTTTTTTVTTTSTSSTTTTTCPPSSGPSTLLEFAQIAIGGGYRAFLVLENPNPATAQAAANFRDPFGRALIMQINGVVTSSVAVSIPPMGTFKIALNDPGPQIRTGWAQVFSDRPINGVIVYQFVDTGQLIAEASVLRSPRTTKFSVLLAELGEETLTGLALANPDESPALLQLKLMTTDGLLVAQSSFTLGSGEQISRFVTQYFPGALTLKDGRVEIVAGRPIIAVGLFFQGQQFTAVPITQLPVP